MPTYSYACTECDTRFDAVQAFTEDALSTCPKCSGRLRKLFNSVGVVFKGSGFYRTDSRESSKSSVPGDAGSSGSEKSSGAEKSSGSEKPSGSEKSAGSEKSSSSTSNAGSSSSGSSSSSTSAPAPASS